MRDSLVGGSWQKLADVEAMPTTGVVQVNDPSGAVTRFYRLTTPKIP